MPRLKAFLWVFSEKERLNIIYTTFAVFEIVGLGTTESL